MWRFIVISLMLSSITGIALNLLSASIDRKQKAFHSLELKIAKQNEKMKVLKAEWAFHTKPEKIAELASQNLQMSDTKFHQIVHATSFSLRNSAWKMQKGISSERLVAASSTINLKDNN